MMFGRKKRQTAIPYDKTGKVPVIRSSICTGEHIEVFGGAAWVLFYKNPGKDFEVYNDFPLQCR